MDKVEVKVNVINQLRLLRQSTFKDILCFLDEDVQNAQRAKAQEIIFVPFCDEHKDEFDPSVDIDMIKELLGVSGQFNKNLKEQKCRYIV